MENMEDALGALDDKMSMMMSRIEQRLDTKENMICGMVNGPSTQIRQKQYEVPDNLPDDLSTIDIDAFAKISDDNATPLVSPTPTAPNTSRSISCLGNTSHSVSCLCNTSYSMCHRLQWGLRGRRNYPHLLDSKQSKGDAESGKAKAPLHSKTFAFFFSQNEELSVSNTEGTHGKQSLDRNKWTVWKQCCLQSFPWSHQKKKRKFGGLLRARLILSAGLAS